MTRLFANPLAALAALSALALMPASSTAWASASKIARAEKATAATISPTAKMRAPCSFEGELGAGPHGGATVRSGHKRGDCERRMLRLYGIGGMIPYVQYIVQTDGKQRRELTAVPARKPLKHKETLQAKKAQ